MRLKIMKYIQKIVAGCIGLCLFACTETDELKTTAGKTGFVVSLIDGSVGVESRKTPAELNVPKTEFTIKVWKAGSDELVASAPCTGETGQVIEVGTGVYDVTAEAGENPLIALDAPYYKGITEDQRVDADKTTNVSIACKVANSLVSVKYDEENLKFSDIYQDGYYVRVVAGGDSEDIKNVENSVYFRAGSAFEVYFCGMKIGETEEKQVKLDVGRTTLQAGDHLILTLSPEPDKYELPLSITKVEVKQETINATIPMEWLPKPKVEAEGFDENNTLTFVETEQKQAALNLNLSSALQDMKFKFNFQDEQFAALDKEKTYQLSIAEDKAAIETALGITLPDVGDKPESIDLSNLLAKIQTNAGVTTTNTIEIDVKANNRWSSEVKEGEEAPNLKYTLTCNKPEFSIAVQPENCWSREFTVDEVTVSGNADAEKIKANLKYQYYNGTDWVDCTTREAVVGRTQQFADAAEDIATKIYKVRALYRGTIASDEVEATLETPMQLPNSKMEEWSYTKDDVGWGGFDYYTFYPYQEGISDIWWATNNQRSQDGVKFGALSYKGSFAPCVSYAENIKPNGNRSALIYTSGHGGHYSSTGDFLYEESAFAGSLFIGKYNWNRDNNPMETINKGHNFSVRPSAFEFWYKYQPKNEDQFKVYIELKNGDEIIAFGEFIPTASALDTDWIKGTISISYSEEAKTATSIYVQFLSTTKTSFSESDFDKDKSFSFPMMSNWKVHMGSMLYIDDLNLVYDK